MRTLRQWAGLKPPASIDPKQAALLVIDFQREYFDGKLPIPDGPQALAAAQALVSAADRLGMAVIYVHHVAANPTAPLFASGSTGAEPVPGMTPAKHHGTVIKRMPSAFFGTDLLAMLQQHACKTVFLCGLMTHNCVDATARDALHLGFSPIVVADACATRDLPGAAGAPPVPAQQLHEAVLAGLADRIAEVVTTEGALALLGQGGAGG